MMRYVYVILFLAASVSGAWGGDLLPDMTNGVASEFASRRSGITTAATFRIEVDRDDLYKIGYYSLTQSGVPTPLMGSELRLFCKTQEVAIYVTTDGAMSFEDYLVFYGEKHDGYYSDTNVYWLSVGGSGLRMATRDGRTNAAAAEVAGYTATVDYDRDQFYRAVNYKPQDETFDHWLAAVIYPTGTTNVYVQTDGRIASGNASIDLKLHGLSSEATISPDHKTELWVQTLYITNVVYDGQDLFQGSATFPAAILADGPSLFSFIQTMPGTTFDAAYLEEFSLHYPRLLIARNDQLGFSIGSAPGAKNFHVDGFSTNSGFWVVDVTDPVLPVLLTNHTSEATGAGFKIRFGDNQSVNTEYFATEALSIGRRFSVEEVLFRDLIDTSRQADVIVICPSGYRWNVFRLARHHFMRGKEVVVTPIDDVYNEFSYGIKDAAAIKQFLGYAFHHWQGPPPKYAVLLGTGSYDPKNNLGIIGARDMIPVHLGPSVYEWTSLENWFATINGSDMLADMALGRIPIKSGAELGGVVDKVIAYDSTGPSEAWRKKALLVADDMDTGDPDFRAASELRVRPNLAGAGFALTTAYLDTTPAGLVESIITNKINSGIFTASFFGHGAISQWADELIFGTNSVPGLTNGIYPVVTVLTCENGDFDEPTRDCLAGELVIHPNGGSIATVGAASLSQQTAAEIFAHGFYRAIVVTNEYRTLGDVVNIALLDLWTSTPEQDELLFYTTFGDPAVTVNP